MARPKFSRRCWCISISIAVIIVIIIVIVVPLAVILPGKHRGKKSTVLLPLYIYPETNTTWSPLYDALEAHPTLKFIVVVNPSSGPGESQYPNEQYTTELQKLEGYPNVQTVGYVRTGYASRNLSTVLAEVSTYAGWSSKSSDLAINGIFFDEAPHEYSADAVEYMGTITQAVKEATGLEGDKTVIRNPGTIPDSRYTDRNTDITVIFEESFPAYQTKEASLEAIPNDRSGYSYMINSVPDMGAGDLGKFVENLSERAEFLFATDNEQEFYESFGSDWARFVDVVPK